MKVICSQTPEALGENAAKHAAGLLRQAIEENGSARLLLSTGASQFTTLQALAGEPVDWEKIEMFHLDEYIGLPKDHPASFVRYLKERFVGKVRLGVAYFVDTSGSVDSMIRELTQKIREKPIDVGLIGIGENAHIAFNDPPADFDCGDAYIIVTLADACRHQQLGEGWFQTLDEVPRQAVTMTVKQILQCRHIISSVPYRVKARAVHDTLTSDITPLIPATKLKEHDDVTLYLDAESASMLDGVCVSEDQ